MAYEIQKMDPVIGAQWVARLESGELHQGEGQLARRGAGSSIWYQCCLDVLCQLAVAAGIVTEHETPEGDRYYLQPGDGTRHSELLPPAVATWAGLKDDPGGCSLDSLDPVIGWSEDYEEVVRASRANDDMGLPFPEIGALIKENLL